MAVSRGRRTATSRRSRSAASPPARRTAARSRRTTRSASGRPRRRRTTSYRPRGERPHVSDNRLSEHWAPGKPGARHISAGAEAEQLLSDLAHLDLLGALGDAVAAVVPVDVLERHVTAVAEPAARLHRAVGGFARETVRPVVA